MGVEVPAESTPFRFFDGLPRPRLAGGVFLLSPRGSILFFTMPMRVVTAPQEKQIMESQIEGRRILSMMLLGTSRSAYGMKKTVRAILYLEPIKLRSSCMPAIFAFPILPRSIYAMLLVFEPG